MCAWNESTHKTAHTRQAALVLSALLAAESFAMAQPALTLAPPAALNTNADTDTADDETPAVASDRRGTWVAVWSTFLSDGGSLDDDLYFARSEDDGATWSEPAVLNSNAADDDGARDLAPAIATDGNGNWIVVWSSEADLGGTIEDDYDILYARSTDNGRTWSDPAALNDYADNDTGNDAVGTIATDGAGRWVTVWTSFDALAGTIGADGDILVSHSDDVGETWSDAKPLNVYAATDDPAMDADQSPFLATDRRGLWLCVWMSEYDLDGTLDDDRDLLLSRSTDGGETWSDPIPLNTTATSDDAPDEDPCLATDSRGNWVAAWSSRNTLGGTIDDDNDILVATSSDDGVTWSAPSALNSTASTNETEEGDAKVTTDGDGVWVACWHSGPREGGPAGPLGNDFDILFSISTDNGQSWTEEMPLDPNAASDTFDDFRVSMATDRRGNWLAVWQAVDVVNAELGDDDDLRFVRVALPDANGNGIGDAQELAEGLSDDCDDDGVPDDASVDCNANGIADTCDLAPLINFSAADPLDTADGPVAIIAVDLNGDLKPDLVVGSEDPSALTLLLSDGAGSFNAPIEFDIAMGITSIASGDFDGDNLPDLALASIFDSRIYVLPNNGGIDEILGGGNPSFEYYDVGDAPLTVVAADLDGDGDIDIATADGDVSVLLNKGDGTFDPAVEYKAGQMTRGLAAADLDGDGDIDLAATASKDNAAAVLLNAGDGTFDDPKLYAAGSDVWGIAAADLDGDGDVDLVTADADLDSDVGPPDTVSLLENIGGARFAPAMHFNVGEAPRTVIAADLDGDGDLDLAASNRVTDDVSILRNRGSLRFSPAQTAMVGDFPQSLCAVDVNGDALPELAVADQFDGTASLLRNQLLPALSADANANGVPDDCASDNVGMNGGMTGNVNGAPCCAVGVPGIAPFMLLGLLAMRFGTRLSSR